MRSKLALTLRSAKESSALIGAGRRVVAGSLTYPAVVYVARWLRRAGEKVAVGLGGKWSAEKEARSLEHLLVGASKSRFVIGLSSLVNAPFEAWPGCRLRRMVDPMINLDPLAQIRLGGWVIVTTVITHIALLGVLDAEVGLVGWALRVGLVAAGLAVMRRPGALASAWKDRAIKRR